LRLGHSDLGHFDAQFFAQVAGGGVERKFGDGDPEVELVAGGTAFEAAEVVLAQVG